MRISDWSSDVCSSDLPVAADRRDDFRRAHRVGMLAPARVADRRDMVDVDAEPQARRGAAAQAALLRLPGLKIGRASCRDRVCQYGSISLLAVSFKKNILYISHSFITLLFILYI